MTELMLTSAGAKRSLAIPSQKAVIIAPPRKEAGIKIKGFDVLKALFTRWGTAIPTKETGPANAVTQADKRLEIKIRKNLSMGTFTPMFLA